MVGPAHLVVDDVQIEVELAGELRLELADLELDDHVAQQLDVEEEEVDEELVTGDLQALLPPREGEAGAKLEHEPLDVLEQRQLEAPLLDDLLAWQEREIVWVPDHLLGEFGLRRGQRAREVRHGGSLASMQLGRNLVDQHIPRPPLGHAALGVPEPCLVVVEPVEQRDVVTPGNLCNRLLHKWIAAPSLRECPHVLEVPDDDDKKLRLASPARRWRGGRRGVGMCQAFG